MTLALWRARKDREEISLQDLEPAISKAVFENPQSESMELSSSCSPHSPAQAGRPVLGSHPHHVPPPRQPERDKGVLRDWNCDPLEVSWRREAASEPADLLPYLAKFFGDKVYLQLEAGRQHSTLARTALSYIDPLCLPGSPCFALSTGSRA